MSLNFLSSTSTGSVDRIKSVHNAAAFGGRMQQPGVKHGPSGAFNTMGHSTKGGKTPDYDEDQSGGWKKGGKKKNKRKKKRKGRG